MRFLFVSTIFILLFASCTQKSNHKSLLTNNNLKFWDISTVPGYCYEFSNNGVCRYYVWMNRNGKSIRELFDFGDVVYPNTWEFVNDTTINIQGFNYFYKFINTDSVKLVNVKRPSDTFFLTSSPNQ